MPIVLRSGTSHHRQPVINTYSWVFNTWRARHMWHPTSSYLLVVAVVSLEIVSIRDRLILQTYLPFFVLFVLFQLYANSSLYFYISGISSCLKETRRALFATSVPSSTSICCSRRPKRDVSGGTLLFLSLYNRFVRNSGFNRLYWQDECDCNRS